MFLSQPDATRLLGFIRICKTCGGVINKVYCSDCDESFEEGHIANDRNTAHDGHCIQRQMDDVNALRTREYSPGEREA